MIRKNKMPLRPPRASMLHSFLRQSGPFAAPTSENKLLHSAGTCGFSSSLHLLLRSLLGVFFVIFFPFVPGIISGVRSLCSAGFFWISYSASWGFLYSRTTCSRVSSSLPHYGHVASMFIHRNRYFRVCKHPALALARSRLPFVLS